MLEVFEYGIYLHIIHHSCPNGVPPQPVLLWGESPTLHNVNVNTFVIVNILPSLWLLAFSLSKLSYVRLSHPPKIQGIDLYTMRLSRELIMKLQTMIFFELMVS